VEIRELVARAIAPRRPLILHIAIEAHAIGVAIVPTLAPIASLLGERRHGGHRKACNDHSGKSAMLHNVTPWLSAIAKSMPSSAACLCVFLRDSTPDERT